MHVWQIPSTSPSPPRFSFDTVHIISSHSKTCLLLYWLECLRGSYSFMCQFNCVTPVMTLANTDPPLVG